ncbi:hypothetical protein PENSPDRAFT_649536, partial [Peniophora sp. CONT]
DLLAKLCPAPVQVSETKESQDATLSSWTYTYQGTAHDVLWEHITDHSGRNVEFYSPFCSIVQSSGTGKSRCIDELSKEHLVVPMCLAAGPNGFPASDKALYAYFQTSTSDPEVRVEAFLCALFDVLDTTIQSEYDDPSVPLAAWFRHRMTAGQTFLSQNEKRISFYNQVVEKAQTLARKGVVKTVDTPAPGSSQPPSPPRMTFKDCPTAREIVQRLRATCRSKTQSELEEPLVLAFDEAHTLSDEGLTGLSSVIQHLRRSLRAIGKHVFSVFLSTTGKIAQFTAPPDADPSNRVSSRTLSLVPPFTALGWGHLAKVLPLEPTFEQIGFDYQVWLGRPLFGTRYVNLAVDPRMDEVMQFATSKILNVREGLPPFLTRDQETAILSHRLPIAFLSWAHAQDERKQVENHMRVCVTVREDFISLATVNSSEPILSEAASNIMSKPSFNAPKALSELLTGFSIHAGNCGELAAMLLVTLARDKVVHAKKQLAHPGFIPVIDFLKSLFASGPVAEGDASIFLAKPSVYNTDSAKDTTLEEAFQDDFLHFNHFIKRGAQGFKFAAKPAAKSAATSAATSSPPTLPTLDRLLGFFLRNAALMGANSQRAFDFITFTCRGYTVRKSAMSIIIYQVKNDSSYSSNAHVYLFDAMDPFKLGIFGPDDNTTIPVIRIVMALAGKVALKCVQTQRKGKFTAYDIWASGLGAATYPIVGDQEQIWGDILRTSQSGWESIYNGQEKAKELKKAMTPSAGDDDASWAWLKTAAGKTADGEEDIVMDVV